MTSTPETGKEMCTERFIHALAEFDKPTLVACSLERGHRDMHHSEDGQTIWGSAHQMGHQLAQAALQMMDVGREDRDTLEAQAKEIKHLESRLKGYQDEIANHLANTTRLANVNNELREQLAGKGKSPSTACEIHDAKIGELNEKVRAWQAIVKKRDETLHDLYNQINEQNRMTKVLQDTVEELRKQIVYRPTDPEHIARLRQIRADLRHDLGDLIHDMKDNR